jgi:hypothetical protein
MSFHQVIPTLMAEFCLRIVFSIAMSTVEGKSGSTIAAKFCLIGICMLAFWAFFHFCGGKGL